MTKKECLINEEALIDEAINSVLEEELDEGLWDYMTKWYVNVEGYNSSKQCLYGKRTKNGKPVWIKVKSYGDKVNGFECSENGGSNDWHSAKIMNMPEENELTFFSQAAGKDGSTFLGFDSQNNIVQFQYNAKDGKFYSTDGKTQFKQVYCFPKAYENQAKQEQGVPTQDQNGQNPNVGTIGVMPMMGGYPQMQGVQQGGNVQQGSNVQQGGNQQNPQGNGEEGDNEETYRAEIIECLKGENPLSTALTKLVEYKQIEESQELNALIEELKEKGV